MAVNQFGTRLNGPGDGVCFWCDEMWNAWRCQRLLRPCANAQHTRVRVARGALLIEARVCNALVQRSSQEGTHWMVCCFRCTSMDLWLMLRLSARLRMPLRDMQWESLMDRRERG